MADLPTLNLFLAEAERNYRLLVNGVLTESAGLGEKNIRYTPASLPQLASYIASLKNQIAALGGNAGLRRQSLVIDL